VPEFEFHKMHGAGNDFVLIDARRLAFEIDDALAARLADRHRGVGCDQILVLRQALEPENRVRYEIFNADGSRAGQCGNGARCIALFLDMADGPQDRFTAESPSGVVSLARLTAGYEVNMGVPDFSPASIPLDLPEEKETYRVNSPWGELEFGAVSMGNPHAVVQVGNLQDPLIPHMGAYLGSLECFTQGVNAGFAAVESESAIRLRVIERGVGETLACGSGACAATAVLRRRGLVGERVNVDLPGGRLVIKWPGDGAPLFMAGPAQHVFKGMMNE
jgi:diaminopimelate epimerase